jgi:serine phosphatase RsbU (regulator of sigma subunit)
VGAADLKSDLRVAVAAYVVIEGRFPARLVSCLDRFVAATGRGEGAALVYMVVQPDTGELRLCSAGMCPPLIVDEHGGRFLHEHLTAPVGAPGAGHRREVSGQLGPGATLLAYTDGLVTGPNRSRARGLASLLDAALTGPLGLEALCGHVVGACANHERRDDDLTVVGARATTTP